MKITLQPSGEVVDIKTEQKVEMSENEDFSEFLAGNFIGLSSKGKFWIRREGVEFAMSWPYMRLIPEKKTRPMVQNDFPAMVWVQTPGGGVFQITGWTEYGSAFRIHSEWYSIPDAIKEKWKWAETHSPQEWRSFLIEEGE